MPGTDQTPCDAPRAAEEGDPRPSTGPLHQAVPLSFVVCVDDEAVLAANLMASPCLGPGARTRSSSSATRPTPRRR